VLCERAGTNIFSAKRDAEISDPSDPLYPFVTGTLEHTSTEILVDMGFNPQEVTFFSADLDWEKYLTQEEFEERYRGDHNDEEWASIFSDLQNTEPSPIAMCYISYHVIYDIKDGDNLSVNEQERIFQNIMRDMQTWLDGQSEEAVFADGFKADFDTELMHICSNYQSDLILLEGEITNLDCFPDDENV
jgi:hypothetical protein